MAIYCSDCGTKNDSAAKFCCGCGTPLVSGDLSVRQQSQIQSSADYDRNAVLMHLNDLRAIECGILELDYQIRKCNQYINQAAKPQSFTEPVDSSNSGFGIIIGGIVIGLVCPFVGWIIDDLIRIVKASSTFTSIGWFIWFAIAVISLVTGLKTKSSMKEKYMNDYEIYQRNMVNDRNRVQNETKEREKMIALRNGLNRDYQRLQNIRNRVYNINIVPSDFRNVYCVYSLYDYMATSSGTLRDAILHCDLKIIQQQLGTVIEQNKRMIVNQYIQQAQNNELIALSRRKILHLKNIEANTERSAQYSEIAAANAEACNYMLTAAYLRDMIR